MIYNNFWWDFYDEFVIEMAIYVCLTLPTFCNNYLPHFFALYASALEGNIIHLQSLYYFC